MSDELRAQALDLFQIAIEAADPKKALQKYLDQYVTLKNRRKAVHLFAVGKAAIPMMEQALDHFKDCKIGHKLAVTNYENAESEASFNVIGAAHPVPDENGLRAAQDIAARLAKVDPDDLVILLLSGGGSALLPYPADGISLSEKMTVTDLLLKSGAPIGEMNTVRRALSRMKGGGFVELSNAIENYAFILSDVPGDVLQDIASGPTVLGSRNIPNAQEILRNYDLWDRLPQSVQDFLNDPKNAQQISSGSKIENTLIGSNRLSVSEMEKRLGAATYELISEWLEGDVDVAAQIFADKILAETGNRHFAFVAGGETAVQVNGNGLGGRNQEMALRVADILNEHSDALKCDWVFLSGGTDGRDGPTDAAGGLVDDRTVSRIADQGADIKDFLANNDSYHGLKLADDLVMTGATGTNVADIQICLVAPKHN